MVQIKQMIVSKSIQNRLTYGGKNPVKYIMIHQTANTSKGANAYMHAKLQANGNSRQASWHYQVDADNIYQSFPDTAQAWHAGNRYYNQNSIGIELTVNSDGNYIGTVEHGAELVKYLMNKHNVPISNVIRHKDASGKYCPRELLDGKNGITWAKFKQMVQGASAPKPAPSKPSKPASNNAKLVKNEDAYFLATTNIKVRNAPSTKATHTGTLKKGDSIHYYKVYEGNGYRWLQYVGNSGNKLYLPYRESGSGKEQWGTFHSSRPGSKSAPKKKTVAQMAKEVNAGKHGTGHANRRKSLGISQSEYDKVRAEVNRLSGVKTSSKPSLTIDQMANKIINDKNAPTGHEARRKWLGIDNATYQKVRARVNQKLR